MRKGLYDPLTMTGNRLTPTDANAQLPLVRSIVAQMIDLGGRVREADSAYRAERARVLPRQDLLNDLWRALRDLKQERDGCVSELATLSVGVDDAATGAIHILGVLDENPVLLCWRFDEPRVDTFRNDGEPFEARRPLPEPVLA